MKSNITEKDRKYMKMAEIWGTNSYAIRNKVGSLIVKDGMIISDGYNGTPSGFKNECETVTGCTCDDVLKCPSHDFDPTMQRHIIVNATGYYKPTQNICTCGNCKYVKLQTKPYVLHAEANAITKVAKSTNNCDGATMYVTLSPCMECSKLIIQSGISRVVYKEKYRDIDGIDLLREAGIQVDQIDEN